MTPAGQLKGFLKILRDLTAQKQAQEQLERSEEQLRLFVENVTDYALFQVDPHGLVIFLEYGCAKDHGLRGRGHSRETSVPPLYPGGP